jgi:hypothetical protein
MHLVRPIAIDTTTLTSSSVAETEAAWNSGTTYALDAAVYRVIDGIHQRFVSKQNGNTNKTPETEPTWWSNPGPTNRWAMFDNTISTQTSDADEIEVVVEAPEFERLDTLYLAGLEGLSVRVRVVDPAEGLVHDETYSLVDMSGVGDWFEWFFEPISYLPELLLVDLPYGAGSTVTVNIYNAGGTARCGAMVIGYRKRLGNTEWGVKTEIRDYSKFIEDDFGNRDLFEGAYRKLANCTVLLENRFKDAVERELTGCRAKVRLYILDENYTTLALLGTARWAVEMSRPPSLSLCSLQIESNI